MKLTDLAHKLEPFINQMIEEYVSLNTNTMVSGGSSFLPREHAIWLLDSGGAAIKDYSADSNGFSSALADATSGDIIWIPAGTIGGNHTLAAGVKGVGASRYATILSGQITLGADSCLENLSVVRSVDSASTQKGVVIGAAGTAYMSGCEISVTNAGAGDAYALGIEDDGDVECWDCHLYASSGGGAAYSIYCGVGAGRGWVYGGYPEGEFYETEQIFTSNIRLYVVPI